MRKAFVPAVLLLMGQEFNRKNLKPRELFLLMTMLIWNVSKSPRMILRWWGRTAFLAGSGFQNALGFFIQRRNIICFCIAFIMAERRKITEVMDLRLWKSVSKIFQSMKNMFVKEKVLGKKPLLIQKTLFTNISKTWIRNNYWKSSFQFQKPFCIQYNNFLEIIRLLMPYHRSNGWCDVCKGWEE